MCEASAYIVDKDGNEKLVMDGVDVLEPEEGGLRLVSLFGEQKFLNARIKTMSLVNHKIVLEEK
jgi:predicted RNA-binding protein